MDIIDIALKEDIGKGDITSNSIIPKNAKSKAVMLAKESGIICGLDAAEAVFRRLDSKIKFTKLVKDGSRAGKNQVIARIEGRTRAILAGERTALNFLQHLSGIATKANHYAALVKPYKTKVLDTRKTIPGLRKAEKYAVKCGGCSNHRFGLYDMVLIKDNHIQAAGNIRKAIQLARKNKKVKIEVEVENIKQLKDALQEKPDIIMLDNMALKDIMQAVKITGKKCKLEVSGGVNEKNIKQVAKTGVDFVSIGNALTLSSKTLDISIKIIK